jgi:hypothetical protein
MNSHRPTAFPISNKTDTEVDPASLSKPSLNAYCETFPGTLLTDNLSKAFLCRAIGVSIR